jgi:hypothetical protein
VDRCDLSINWFYQRTVIWLSLPTNESWRKVLKYCKTASLPLTAIYLRMSMDMKFYIDIGGSHIDIQ